MNDRVLIDGSMGEGGGQILRTSLALSLATGRPVRIENIRARRSRPGLGRQHLAAVEAARRVGDARVEGAALGSTALGFEPQGVHAGVHHIDVGTAGSTCLVAQCVLPALLFAGAPTELVIEGGTHTHFAPPFELLAEAWVPLLHRIGADVEVELERPGFYPVGGGSMRVRVGPAPEARPLELRERGRQKAVEARVLLSKLPRHVAERELRIVRKVLGWQTKDLVVDEVDAAGPGNAVLLKLVHEHVTEVFVGYGKQGVPAEQVARGACREAKRWLKTDVPVGEHLADQLMLPLALGAGGVFHTTPLTPHGTTNLAVIGRFLEVALDVEEVDEGVVAVHVGTSES